MHISHVHKTVDNNYLQNKHTSGEVLITYTLDASDVSNNAFAITVEDLKTVEGVFVQGSGLVSGEFAGDYYSNPNVVIEGNKVTISKRTTAFPFLAAGTVHILAFGKR